MNGVKPLLTRQRLDNSGRTTRPGPLRYPVLSLFLESTHPSCDGGVVATCFFRYLGYGMTTFMKGNDFSLLEEIAVVWHVLSINLSKKQLFPRFRIYSG